MKKVLTILLSLTVVFAIAQERVGTSKEFSHDPGCVGFVMTNMDGTVITPSDLVESILGAGVAYSNISFTGLPGVVEASAGFFTGGMAAGIGIEEGIVLSSGYITNAIGPNSSESITGFVLTGGDADLDALIPGFTTEDATVLQFDFVPDFSTLYFEYVFGSDEYNEFVGSSYNDVFGFFLNGTNIALIPSTTTPVSINNVNLSSNPAYYKNNSPGPFCTEMDGFTTKLVASGTVTPNTTNTIKLAVADAGDSSYDAWVYIKGGSFGGVDPEVPVSNWALFIGIGLILVFAIIRFRRLV
jgi:hypothetical protein